MKRNFLLYSLTAGIAVLTFSSYGNGPFQGGAGNHTGSAGSAANCSTGSGCHANNGSATQATIVMTTLTNQPVTSYTHGTTYKVTVAGTNSGALPRFGFQASCVKAASTSTQAGTFTATASNTSVRTATPLQLIEHNAAIPATSVTGGTAVYSVSFNWVAPAASGTGTVRFYATLNAVNFNGNSTGDQPNSAASVDYPESSSAGVGNIVTVHMSVYPNPAVNTLHLKLDGPTGHACSLQIWDMGGRIAMSQSANVVNGEVLADVNRLNPGNYYVLASQNGRQYAAAFTKQ